jgi:hypothetical protein
VSSSRNSQRATKNDGLELVDPLQNEKRNRARSKSRRRGSTGHSKSYIPHCIERGGENICMIVLEERVKRIKLWMFVITWNNWKLIRELLRTNWS